MSATVDKPRTHKVCPRCSRYLPMTAFSTDRTKRSGRKSWCKDCDAMRARKRTGPRPKWLDVQATMAKPVALCRCVGQRIEHEDEGEIRCLKCGKPTHKPTRFPFAEPSENPNRRLVGAP